MAELRARIGLDRPMVEQYLAWAGAALHGDFGKSLWTGRPVLDEIAAPCLADLELTLLSLAGRRRPRRAGGLPDGAAARACAPTVAMRVGDDRRPDRAVVLVRHRHDL